MKEIQEKMKKSEKGSVTLFVLVSMMFTTMFLLFAYTNQTNRISEQKRQIAEIQRKYNSDDMETIYNRLQAEQKQTLSQVEEAKINGNVLNESSPTTITDQWENKIVVPEGFKIAEDSGTDVTGGIVIEDVSAGTETTRGSQFVWIPVGEVKYENGSKTIELDRYIFSDKGVPTGKGADTIDSYYQELATSSYGNTTAIGIEEFKPNGSVEKNGGYYIGRYEAGDPTATTERTSSSNETIDIVCKENQYVYNNVSQTQSATLARGMYTNKKFTSDLMNSYAWDTAIVFIQEFSEDIDYSKQNGLQNTLAKTGKATDGTNYDVRCNIYDMAGNCCEWTTETSSESDRWSSLPAVFRGGGLHSDYYTSERNSIFSSCRDANYTFRPLLYLNET